MRLIKLIAILSLGLFFFGLLAVLHLCISVLRLPDRWKIVSRWMRGFTWSMTRILNIRITVQGDAGQLERGGYVIISNHSGYLDGIVLGSLFPVIFVSKQEVKSWPVLGQWTTLCGTVFINRQQKGLIPLAVKEMSLKLKQRANILLFPEGAATNGERMLPFQTAPLAAPLRSRAIIVPITLAYQRIDGQPVSAANRDLVYCYDDMPDIPHFWKLLTLRRIEAKVTIRPKIDCSRYEDNSAGRKKLAEDCYNRVSGRMRAHQDADAATNSRGLFSS
ncbi:MAG TPA: lysophospholipid acyltransferase family protein [Candidatus Binatia bacterium]|jgi:1-acyl-sn-glycerol-3-phosphate acyltransferase